MAAIKRLEVGRRTQDRARGIGRGTAERDALGDGFDENQTRRRADQRNGSSG